MKTKQYDQWDSVAHAWQDLGPPLRPCAADIAVMENWIHRWSHTNAAAGPNTLLWGVTPEIAELAWPSGSEILAVDRSAKMIHMVWPGDIEGRRRAICGDWFEAPDATGEFDIVIGDGVFTFLDFPDQYQALLVRGHRLLRKNGIVITRFFARPSIPESPGQVFDDLRAGRIGNFHVFKFRLAMALQENSIVGVRMGDVFETWVSADIDRDALSASTGWTPNEISTIDQYQNMDSRRCFPSLEEVDEVIGKHFTRIDCRIPKYELGDRCRIVCYQRMG